MIPLRITRMEAKLESCPLMLGVPISTSNR